MRLAIIVATTCLTALLLAGQGGISRTLFPIVFLGLTIFAYVKQRSLYMDLVLWIIFLSPFLRRVMDLQAGWKDPSFVLLTPYLVVLVGPAVDWRRMLSAPLTRTGPFVLAMLAVLYGMLMTLQKTTGPTNASQIAQWIVPVVTGFWFSTASSDDQSLFRRSIERSFLWGTLAMSCYAVYQFVSPPAWDVNWYTQLSGSADLNSMGTPAPFGLRPFSTMNSAGVFAFVITCGLLLLAPSRRRLAPVSFCAGLIALVLTMVRSAWAAALLGLVLLAFVAGRNLARNVAGPFALALLLTTFIPFGPTQDLLGTRLNSFVHPDSDESKATRILGAAKAMSLVLSHPLGLGVGLEQDTVASDGSFALHDNGLIEGLLSLGLIGAPLYFCAIGVLLFRAFRSPDGRRFKVTPSGVIALSLASQLPLGSSNLGVPGILLWTFAAYTAGATQIQPAKRYARLPSGSTHSDPSGPATLQHSTFPISPTV